VVSFICLHERGFNTPASKFMRGLCYHYGVELHNFAPNSILQAATFVGVCKGFLGVSVSWYLWIHLFRGALHGRQGQGPAPARLRRWAHVRVTEHGNLRVPALQHDDQQLRGDMVWFYLRNDGAGLPPYTGKVLDSRPYN
jgi:hypothetical protein